MNAPAASPGTVLVVNSGASSLKFALYPRPPAGAGPVAPIAAITRGRVDGLQAGGTPRLCLAGQPPRELDTAAGTESTRHAAAHEALQAHLAEVATEAPVRAVAHRIVHGGPHYRAPVALDDAVLALLATLEPLAPLHQPYNLAGVRALRRAYPDRLQLACFDTAFHATLPRLEQRYALPAALHEQGLRRYGFHGLSYQAAMAALRRNGAPADGRVLMAHLGRGASLCGAQGGHSVTTTMGFSVLDGLVMGSRCGQLDPGIVLHLWRQGWTLADVERLLYRESGLVGVSGLSADLAELREAATGGHAQAQLAIDLFDQCLRREAGGLSAELGGLDLLAFTGDIGTHDAQTRAELARGLSHLGIRLDADANRATDGAAPQPIHAADSAVEVWVVPPDEGRVAAEAAWAMLDRLPAGRTAPA
jgi:acetate kinase